MRQPSNRLSLGLSSIGIVLVLGLAVPSLKAWYSPRKSPLESLATAVVRRADLHVTLTTGGWIDCLEKTVVECELERLSQGGGTSTVLYVIPEGTDVKKGEILCELDASEYEEVLRQQRIAVEKARADHRRAELDLDVARVAVREFKEGLMIEALEEFAGEIALGEVSLERSKDRLVWARRMLEKGYVPITQLSTEELSDRSAALKLQQSRTALDIFQRFSVPRFMKTLEGGVYSAEALLNYQIQRLKSQVERQERLEKQVENCTIRAPHDGFVVYAFEEGKAIRIEEGLVVRNRQDLFYLPNRSQMIVKLLVHESVAKRVLPGMLARVRVDGLPEQVLEAHVMSVNPLALHNSTNGISYFYTIAILDTVCEGLKPGLTAEVRIATDRRDDVLAIPLEAYRVEKGRDVCYVASLHGVERRAIQVGQATKEMLEVFGGLKEGEHVVLDPAQFDEGLETLSPFRFRSPRSATKVRAIPPKPPDDPAPSGKAKGRRGRTGKKKSET